MTTLAPFELAFGTSPKLSSKSLATNKTSELTLLRSDKSSFPEPELLIFFYSRGFILLKLRFVVFAENF